MDHRFRIESDSAGLLPAAVIHSGDTIPTTQYTLTEVIFYSGLRFNRWEDEDAFGSLTDRYDGVPRMMLAAAGLRHVAATKWGTKRYLQMNRLAEDRAIA